MISEKPGLNRTQIRAVFRRHRGEASKLAAALGISPQNISDWMNGVGRSARVDEAVRRRAAELLAQEGN